MWNVNQVRDLVDVVGVTNRFGTDIEERGCRRAFERSHKGVSIVFHVDEGDEVRAFRWNDQLTAANLFDNIGLKCAGAHEQSAFQDGPAHRLGLAGEQSHHAFHDGDWVGDFTAFGGLVDPRVFIEPIIASIAISHDDALLNEASDTDIKGCALQAAGTANAEMRIGGQRTGSSEVPRYGRGGVDNGFTTLHHRRWFRFHAGNEKVAFNNL